MGEAQEEKKQEEQKMEEKKPEEPPKQEEEEEAKTEDKKDEEKKSDETPLPPPPPPPPQEIVLKVYMHCEGCAKKVRRCLRGFPGVEDVLTDCKTHKVVVKGEKADPLMVLDRVQKKSHRQVQLISPIPNPPPPPPPAEEPKTDPPKPEEPKETLEVITVALKVHMHCEACAQEIKRRILKMKGVDKVDADLKTSQVTVKGIFDPPKLLEYVYKRTGKQAVILKQEIEKKEEAKEEEKVAAPEENVAPAVVPEETTAAPEVTAVVPEEKKEGEETAVEAVVEGGETGKVVEVKKNEFYYYYPTNYQIHPPRFATEMYSTHPGYAPQMFSDENPNACMVM